MKYYDLTLPLSAQTPPWPGDQPFTRTEKKSGAIVSRLLMSSHSGTHIDAPKHFLFTKPGIDNIKPEVLIGSYEVFGLKSKHLISGAEIKDLPLRPGMRVLMKTSNSLLITKNKFTSNYISFSLEAAQLLVKKRVALVGIDYFGIEPESAPGNPVHKLLLKNNIVIVENLNLSQIPAGTYQGAILPLLIKAGDGAPARAVLWK